MGSEKVDTGCTAVFQEGWLRRVAGRMKSGKRSEVTGGLLKSTACLSVTGKVPVEKPKK